MPDLYAAPPAHPGAYGRDRATVAARLRRVAYLTGQGWTARQIAAELGVSKRVVEDYRRKARGGKPAPPRPAALTAAQAGQAVELYAAGLSAARVAGRLGVPYSAVYRMLAARGLARTRAETARQGYETRVASGVQRVPRPPVRPVPEHGTRARWCRGCKCVLCRDANREYARSWRAARAAARREACG